MKNRVTEWFGENAVFLETVDSTNDEARRRAEQGAPEGTLIFAETQTGGRGRRGRRWITQPGSAIAMSMLLRPDIRPENASRLTLIMGLAVAQACREYCKIPVQIKWPNDVVADGKKICGILTEMKCEADQIEYIIIGTGINTHVTQFPDELKQTAVSLHQLMGENPDRAELAALCIQKFDALYEIFQKTQDLSGLTDQYNALLAGKGGMVRVLEPEHAYNAVAEGINAQGELQVRKEDGERISVYAGEVSVRGIYGYI